MNSEVEVSGLIYNATVRDGLFDPDWETNLKIVDRIKKKPELCYAVVQTFERQLKDYYYEPRVLWLTLILLEMCVKNCGYPFHKEIARKSFLNRLLKTGGKQVSNPKKARKNRPTTSKGILKQRVQKKVLQLIQAWGPLHPDDLPVFNITFQELKAKGVEFPPPSPEDLAPITNEKREELRQSGEWKVPSNSLRQFMEESKRTIMLLESILESLEPNERAKDNEVAVELAQGCKEKLPQVIKLIEEYSDNPTGEKMVSALLLLFERFEKVLNHFENGTHPAQLSSKASPIQSSRSLEEEEPPEIEERNPFRSSNVSSPPLESKSPKESKSPLELGWDLISSTEPQNPSNDPFLDWLVQGVSPPKPSQNQ